MEMFEIELYIFTSKIYKLINNIMISRETSDFLKEISSFIYYKY